MPLFDAVQSLRMRNLASSPSADFLSMTSNPYSGGNGFMDAFKSKPPPHSSHPDFANLSLLVFEAVMEVVCVSLPGYIVARMGMFDAEAQKFVANLNTQLFTPCLSKCPSWVKWAPPNSSQYSQNSRRSSALTSWSSWVSYPSSSSSN
jgi:hypothetical protein